MKKVVSRSVLVVSLISLCLLSSTGHPTASQASGDFVTMSVDGSQTFQRMAGFGVNINSASWRNGELTPALDFLADQLGASIWRIVIEIDDLDRGSVLDGSAFSTGRLPALWSTIAYLNQKSITSNIILCVMGPAPAWVGGGHIDPTAENEWAHAIASLVYYGRRIMNLQFDILDPLNEPDSVYGIEGPSADAVQYTRLLSTLSSALDGMNLTEIRLIGPSTAYQDDGVGGYLPQMLTDDTVMSKLDHFGFHDYSGYSAGADAAIKNSPYPDKDFWVTEVTNGCDIFTHLGNNPAATLVWDGYESVYFHAILAGRGTQPPNDSGNGPSLLGYDQQTGTYVPYIGFYEDQQIFSFVPRGSMRIGLTLSSPDQLVVYAFYSPAGGQIVLVGRTPLYPGMASTDLVINGSVTNLPTVSIFQVYTTTIFTGVYSQRGADVPVSQGSFTVTVPANSTFALVANTGTSSSTTRPPASE